MFATEDLAAASVERVDAETTNNRIFSTYPSASPLRLLCVSSALDIPQPPRFAVCFRPGSRVADMFCTPGDQPRVFPYALETVLPPEPSIIIACAAAFAAVFGLLTFLAVVMQLITLVFPEDEPSIDSPVVAAISSAVASVIPGARVVRIEEES